MTALTFVVPTIPTRESLLSRCLWSLQNQAPGVDTEILVVAGDGKLGDKVNAGVAAASGAYVTVVDDDDYVRADYCAQVAGHLWDRRIDYLGFRVLELLDGRYSGETLTVGDSKSWRAPRGPIPKGVTRTEIARQVTMGNSWKSDREWMASVAPLVETCAHVNEALYVYDNWPASSMFVGRGAQRDVGMWPFDETLVRRIAVDRFASAGVR